MTVFCVSGFVIWSQVKCDVTTLSAERASGAAPVLNVSHLADILSSSGAETSLCSS